MQTSFIGVDVSKSELVISVDDQPPLSVANDMVHITRWLAVLPRDCFIAMESTGRYHLELARKLVALRLKLNPDAVLVANGYLGEIFNLLMARLCFRMVLAYTPLIVSFGELGSTWPGLKDALFRFFTSRLANLRFINFMSYFNCFSCRYHLIV